MMASMAIRPFEPKFMKVGVLTAALQELTPRAVRDPDPDRAIEDWIEFAKELNAGYLQLSAALHPSEADVPPEAMLDPVANTLDLRKPFDSTRARRVEAALKANGIGLSDIAYFDNMLHHDAAVRQKKHEFMLRVFDAAVLLGVDAVCGFVGRNQQRSMDQNLLDFEAQFVPLLAAAKSRGLTYRVEQCPMAGLDDGRQLAQQHRLHARHVDRAAPDLREARRRRSVPHPLRSLARDPDGAGHAVDLPVPERHRLQLPHRRLPREGPGDRCAGRRGVGLRRPDGRARRLGRRPAVGERRRSAQRLEETHRLQRARAARHGAARSARVPAEPHGRLARSSARRARAAAARRGEHASRRRARVSEGAPPGSRARQADPPGLDRVRASHRRSRRVHVRAAARGAGRAGDPGPGVGREAYRS